MFICIFFPIGKNFFSGKQASSEAKKLKDDILDGLKVGADDYLTKQAWQLHCRSVIHMTPLQSAVYALCVLEGMSESQMAKITGMTGFRIALALERAEDKVRSELKDYGKEDQYDSYNGFLRRVAEGMLDVDKLNKMIIFAV